MICSTDLTPRAAIKRVTWVNSGNGIGSGLQGGPMCEACMTATCARLRHFPDAHETLTIWPLGTIGRSGTRHMERSQ